MTVDPRTKAAPSALQRGLETALGAPLAIRRVPIDSNHLDPAHARSPPQRNLDAIRSSLARFGQAEPLVSVRDGLQNLRVIEAIAQAVRTGQAVQIS